jgi:hypothetical protein
LPAAIAAEQEIEQASGLRHSRRTKRSGQRAGHQGWLPSRSLGVPSHHGGSS